MKQQLLWRRLRWQASYIWYHLNFAGLVCIALIIWLIGQLFYIKPEMQQQLITADHQHYLLKRAVNRITASNQPLSDSNQAQSIINASHADINLALISVFQDHDLHLITSTRQQGKPQFTQIEIQIQGPLTKLNEALAYLEQFHAVLQLESIDIQQVKPDAFPVISMRWNFSQQDQGKMAS